MHFTPSWESRKCKECDVFFNPMEVYQGEKPNNFEAGYRTRLLVDKKKKKVYINIEKLRYLLKEKELKELLEAGSTSLSDIDPDLSKKTKDLGIKNTVKATTTSELVKKIKKIIYTVTSEKCKP